MCAPGERTATLFASGRRARLNCAVVQDPDLIGTLRRLDADDPLVHELARLEPVNPVRSPADLQRRLAADRLLYVLTVDDRPTVALWVAFTRGIPVRLGDVLHETLPVLEPDAADTAVFHSVWNVPGSPSVPGAARSTILQAIGDLREQRPSITTASTISPIPGLRSWAPSSSPSPGTETSDRVRLAERYLHEFDDDNLPLDPVARFHLTNGARLWRVLPEADPSALGEERSWGIMVNYRYEPEDRVANRALLATGCIADGTAP
ncbi:MAG: hypothetical protein FJW94_13305 [Actinobacteria bacterium]|nr:hypothetical protein [Actinomycetota bacterium]